MLKRILALGDSYTIGTSVEESDRWPVQLAAALRETGLDVAAPQIVARNGWTTAELAAGIAAAELAPPYDLVTLLIGVNNQYRGYSQVEYAEQFAELLGQAIEFAGGDAGKVIVVSIPDWGATPYAAIDPRGPQLISEQVAAFNAINRAGAELAGVRYVDIYPISQRAYEDAALIASDGLHPSASQYALWVAAVMVEAVDVLGP